MNSVLFQPFRLHDMNLANRIVLSPMTRSRAGAARLANQVKGGAGVQLSEFDDLFVIVPHTLNRRRIAVFDEIGGVSRGGVHFFVSFFGLCRALFLLVVTKAFASVMPMFSGGDVQKRPEARSSPTPLALAPLRGRASDS
jgi:hypothetical protein